MKRKFIKLKLDLHTFDDSLFAAEIERCRQQGVLFETMHSVGDSPTNRLALYTLNKTCSADIPGRGKFFTYEEFTERRFGERYDPAGVILACHEGKWVGMAAHSNWSHKGFVFNEMTGILRPYRRLGIATALKLLGIRYAISVGARYLYTIHDSENSGMIQLNRRLGYVDTERDSLFD